MNNAVNNFENQFLNIDFDKILLDQNNTIINSNEHYLIYKNRYFTLTNENLENYTNLLNKYNSLTNNQFVTETGKVKYYFTNADDIDSIQEEMNKLLMSQRKLYDNFINHVYFLNNVKQKLLKNPKKSNDNFSAKKLLSKFKF